MRQGFCTVPLGLTGLGEEEELLTVPRVVRVCSRGWVGPAFLRSNSEQTKVSSMFWKGSRPHPPLAQPIYSCGLELPPEETHT